MQTEDRDLKRTFLCERHTGLSARMAGFGGFLMPIQYEGILAEHQATRERTAVFDTCHMGEFLLTGPGALADLDRIVSCTVSSLVVGQCRYGFMCNETGGVIDDLLVYRKGDQAFMLVVNADTQDTDFQWIQSHLSADTRAEDISGRTGKLDIQGPGSPAIVARLMAEPVSALRFYRFMENTYRGHDVIVSRTGYTGEIGFEVYGSEEATLALWDDCMNAGVTPAGLGARDTLRLEMGMPLYGHELSVDRNAAQAGFTKAIASDKEFIGSEAVHDDAGREIVLAGLTLQDRRAAREGDAIQASSGEAIGSITSGSFAPSVGNAVALGYLKVDHAAEGSEVVIQTGRHALPATIMEPPFYRDATARAPMEAFLEEE